MSKITACYCGTKNSYMAMAVAMKSLLAYNDVEKIYAFIEDDEFPYKFDDRICAVNVSNQQYVTSESPNYNTRWTYMTFIRCFFTKYITEHRVIYMDNDTIVTGDLADLWNMDLHGNAVAAVWEPRKNPLELYLDFNKQYVNTGVLLMDLDTMRNNHFDDALIEMLRSETLAYPDQDAINYLLKGYIYIISSKFNSSIYTCEADDAAIVHCTPIKPWNRNSHWYRIWNKYKSEIENDSQI